MAKERRIRKRLLALVVFVLVSLFAVRWATRPVSAESGQAPVPNESSVPKTQLPSNANARDTPTPIPSPAENARVAVEQKNVAVNFWARVVDQSDLPVSGVKLSVGVRHWGLASQVVGASFRHYERETGADGIFEVLNSSGDVLTIESIQKTGYSVPQGVLRSYGFNISTNVSVDREHPLVIRIWRKIGEQRLLKGDILCRSIIPDGRPYSIDLVTKVRSEGTNGVADLRISLTRPEGMTRADKYDWSFSIEAIDGGIMECNEDTPLVAPQIGYMSSYIFRRSRDEERFGSFHKVKLFVKTRGGQIFAVLKAEIYSVYDNSKSDAAVWLDYIANTNHSPVLQN